jgi:hypothetical protein
MTSFLAKGMLGQKTQAHLTETTQLKLVEDLSDACSNAHSTCDTLQEFAYSGDAGADDQSEADSCSSGGEFESCDDVNWQISSERSAITIEAMKLERLVGVPESPKRVQRKGISYGWLCCENLNASPDEEYDACLDACKQMHAKTIASYDDLIIELSSSAQCLTDVKKRTLKSCMASFIPQDPQEIIRSSDEVKPSSAEHIVVVGGVASSLFQALLSVFESEVPADLKQLNPDQLAMQVEAFEGYAPVRLVVTITSQDGDASQAMLTHTSGDALRFWRLMQRIEGGLRAVGMMILQPTADCPIAASTLLFDDDFLDDDEFMMPDDWARSMVPSLVDLATEQTREDMASLIASTAGSYPACHSLLADAFVQNPAVLFQLLGDRESTTGTRYPIAATLSMISEGGKLSVGTANALLSTLTQIIGGLLLVSLPPLVAKELARALRGLNFACVDVQ